MNRVIHSFSSITLRVDPPGLPTAEICNILNLLFIFFCPSVCETDHILSVALECLGFFIFIHRKKIAAIDWCCASRSVRTKCCYKAISSVAGRVGKPDFDLRYVIVATFGVLLLEVANV